MTQRKPRRQCIFCDNFANSKEHFYPQWMGPLLAESSGPAILPSYIEHFIVDDPFDRTVEQKRKEKPGELATKKIRTVCDRCNNGWMNLVEQGARGSLTSLILGEPVTLTEEQRLVVARWFAIKMLIVEHGSEDTAVYPKDVRRALRSGSALPSKFRIYVCQHSSNAKTGLMRQTGLVSGAKSGLIPELGLGLGKNIQQITFITGKAVAHINASTADVELEDFLDYSNLLPVRLWPPTEQPFASSGGPVLNYLQLNNLGWSLNAVLRGPRTRVGDRKVGQGRNDGRNTVK